MRFTPDFVAEMSNRVRQMGLQYCSVCKSGEGVNIDSRPVVLTAGGPFFPEPDDPRRESELELLFLARFFCDSCGHNMLFDPRKFAADDAQVIMLERP